MLSALVGGLLGGGGSSGPAAPASTGGVSGMTVIGGGKAVNWTVILVVAMAVIGLAVVAVVFFRGK